MSTFSDFIKQVKGWGLTAFAALGAFAVFAILGWWFTSGTFLGVFLTRNWDIIVNYIKQKNSYLNNYE